MTDECSIFHDLFAQSLTGHLSVDEADRFRGHLAICPDCAKAYQDLQNLESDMTALFAATQPDAMFESRMLRGLQLRSPRRIHPLVQKIAVGLAASIVLGGFGYFGQKVLESKSVGAVSLNHPRNPDIETLVDGANHIAGAKIQAGSLVVPATESWYANGTDLKFGNNHDEVRKNVMYGYTGADFNIQENNAYLGRKHAIQNSPDDRPTAGEKTSAGFPFQAGNYYFDSKGKTANLGDKVSPSFGVAFRPSEWGLAQTKPGLVQKGVAVIAQNVVADDESKSADAPTNSPVKPDAAEGVSVMPGQPENQTAQSPVIQTKIIRNGEVEFEVDSFDSSVVTASKIINEEGGYIGTTSSEKLPNGKVKGVLIVRVPPGNLDTLVLKLRGLGDLKRQNLSANDVTKQYYDLSSELRAAKAMQERLLEIIKTGNAQVKDLLSVEKELATWRGKIEKLEGEVRYYDNLVSLSTLNIAITERDIRTAAAIKEIETADAGVEVSDVEAARASAIASIEEAKGRIIEAELKKLDAGQFAAKVIADVPAESAGTVIDRLKQIGKVARLEISRKQTTPDNSAPQAGAKVERGDTHIVASFYNLANVAPRQTVTMQMASDDVAKTYAAILVQIEKANGRVVTSNLQQPRPDETSGMIQFELPANVADQNLQQLQQSGLVLQMTVAENPDTANVTSAKRGFNLTLIGSRAIAPRQTLNLTTEASDVAQTSASVTTFVQSIGGRIVDTNQSTATGGASSASLRVEVPVAKLPELLGKIESTTKIRAQQSAVRTQVPDGPAARALVDLKIQSPDAIVSSENGFFPSLRRGLSTSVAGLFWSLQLIIIGVCLVAPWALLVWGGIKFWKRRRAV
jgi:hypothetical protein